MAENRSRQKRLKKECLTKQPHQKEWMKGHFPWTTFWLVLCGLLIVFRKLIPCIAIDFPYPVQSWLWCLPLFQSHANWLSAFAVIFPFCGLLISLSPPKTKGRSRNESLPMGKKRNMCKLTFWLDTSMGTSVDTFVSISWDLSWGVPAKPKQENRPQWAHSWGLSWAHFHRVTLVGALSWGDSWGQISRFACSVLVWSQKNLWRVPLTKCNNAALRLFQQHLWATPKPSHNKPSHPHVLSWRIFCPRDHKAFPSNSEPGTYN